MIHHIARSADDSSPICAGPHEARLNAAGGRVLSTGRCKHLVLATIAFAIPLLFTACGESAPVSGDVAESSAVAPEQNSPTLEQRARAAAEHLVASWVEPTDLGMQTESKECFLTDVLYEATGELAWAQDGRPVAICTTRGSQVFDYDDYMNGTVEVWFVECLLPAPTGDSLAPIDVWAWGPGTSQQYMEQTTWDEAREPFHDALCNYAHALVWDAGYLGSELDAIIAG